MSLPIWGSRSFFTIGFWGILTPVPSGFSGGDPDFGRVSGRGDVCLHCWCYGSLFLQVRCPAQFIAGYWDARWLTTGLQGLRASNQTKVAVWPRGDRLPPVWKGRFVTSSSRATTGFRREPQSAPSGSLRAVRLGQQDRKPWGETRIVSHWGSPQIGPSSLVLSPRYIESGGKGFRSEPGPRRNDVLLRDEDLRWLDNSDRFQSTQAARSGAAGFVVLCLVLSRSARDVTPPARQVVEPQVRSASDSRGCRTGQNAELAVGKHSIAQVERNIRLRLKLEETPERKLEVAGGLFAVCVNSSGSGGCIRGDADCSTGSRSGSGIGTGGTLLVSVRPGVGSDFSRLAIVDSVL